MPLLEAFRIAFQMIWAQKLKSSFSVVGVFIGVTFLIAVVTIVEGMNQYMTDRFATLLGANTFQLRRYPDFEVGDTSREQWREWRRRPRITTADAIAVADGIQTRVLTAWESQSGANVDYRGRVVEGVRIIGATEQYFDIREWNIEEGRPFTAQEVRFGRPVVVIGRELADRIFEEVDPIGQELRIRSLPYRVIGIVESQGNIFGISLDKFVVAPALSPVKRFVNPHNVVDILLVKAETAADMRAAMIEAEAIMRSRRALRPTQENNFALETAEAILEFWGRINQVMALALPGLVGISLVVGGIVIMNIMLMSVSERTAEIGIRKALGAKRQDIRRQFLVESATLSVAGAGLGIATGLGAAALIEAATPLPAAIAPWSLVVGVLLGAGVGIIAGLYPATRAARLDPVDAMRHE
ncbi:MAG: ABC transporter permease [Gemmatimonadetes bacterium]|nr:ABC transporter permease [Gemmatimonadota bacterium]